MDHIQIEFLKVKECQLQSRRYFGMECRMQKIKVTQPQVKCYFCGERNENQKVKMNQPQCSLPVFSSAQTAAACIKVRVKLFQSSPGDVLKQLKLCCWRISQSKVSKPHPQFSFPSFRAKFEFKRKKIKENFNRTQVPAQSMHVSVQLTH